MKRAAPGAEGTEILYQYLEKDNFLEKYLRKDRFEEDCRLCPYYGKRWSCPPGLPDTCSYLEPYQSLCLVVLKVNYPESVRQEAQKDADLARRIREDRYESAKKELLTKLLELEEKIPGSRMLGAGCCVLCGHCAREQGKPCRYPQKRRYSITGFGLNFSSMLKEVFDLELLWADRGLPKYDVAAASLFLREKIGEIKKTPKNV